MTGYVRPDRRLPPVTAHLLAVPETTPTALYAFREVFHAAGRAWTELTGEPAPSVRIEARIVAREKSQFTAALGAPVQPDLALAAAAPADLVVVTDLALHPDPAGLPSWHAECDWLRAQYAAGAILASVCTGAVLIAESGLLDGTEATSHWSAGEMFRSRYPAVRFRPERILCQGGPGHRIVTSGGPGSWEDLAMHLVARFCGPEEAVRLAKVFVLGDRSAGQLPFTAMGRAGNHGDAAIGACQEWLADHYAETRPVARMAARSGLAERSFKRRFKAATGYTPVDYVQALRIEEAKHLLEVGAMSIDDVAQAVGYEDPSFFRRLFKRRTGVTPARYRRQFSRFGGWKD
ncbi:GlxA family transcriptional regulator [Marinibaculum pumilum]|uniref:GlxA family transcriptional regulator n=1 Tax=Marinibaculum pumilum TaxID=1766165 RepID=A0ABV7KVA7_9PROT